MAKISSENSISISSWIYFGLCVITVIDAIQHSDFLDRIGAGLIILFLLFEYGRVPNPQKVSGTVLIILALAAAINSGQYESIVFEGIGRARIFLILFFAIAWLQFPVKESPSLKAVRNYIVLQPPGRRFFFLASGAHILGSVLNLAGLSLLTSNIQKQRNLATKRRLSVALMQGFTSASCWSPFYIGMIVVLISIPGVSWLELAPWGILMAILLILAGWVFDRAGHRPDRSNLMRTRPTPVSRRHLATAIFILVSLVGITVLIVELTRTNIPVTLSIMAPIYALIWFGRINIGRETRSGKYKRLAFGVLHSLSSYRNEVLLFVAANMFGAGVASLIPASDWGAALNTVIPWPDVKIVLLMATFLVASASGLHPVIVVVAVSAVFPPSALGLDDWIVALAFVGAWGISTMVSPFSGTTLFMSRIAGLPGHIIGWRWSPPMVLISILVLTVYIILIRNLFA